MAHHPVVHFEIIGRDPAALRTYYGELFGWTFDTSGPVSPSVSEAGQYGFVNRPDAPGEVGIPGGVGGGKVHEPRVLFYVGVPDVEAALRKAEGLGGVRRMGPERAPGIDLTVAYVADPEGNVIGLAATA